MTPSEHRRIRGFQQAALVQRKVYPLRQAITLGIIGAALTTSYDHTELVVYWGVINLVVQLAEHIATARFIVQPLHVIHKNLKCALALMLVPATVFGSVSVVFWAYFGSIGLLAFVLIIVGGILHNTMNMQSDRTFLTISSSPFVAFLLFTPLFLTPEHLQDTQSAMIGLLIFSAMLFDSLRNQMKGYDALQHALDAARRAQTRAEKATKAKSEFLAVMSHEIRTPMNAVVAAAHLFNDAKLEEKHRRNARMLLNAADALSALLNDVIDITRVEAGKLSIEPVETAIREKLEGLGQLWRTRAEQKGLGFSVRIDDSVPETVRIDALRLQQVVSNLLSNAMKFTERGEVALSATWSRTTGLTIAVRDSGCGIAEDKLASVFETFEQVTEQGVHHPGGAGLGLAISRRLAELMGGRMTLESTLGRGSTFSLTVPAQAMRRSKAKPTRAARETLDGMRVLAADDNDVNRIVLEALLSPLGCVVTLTCDGAEAVEAARRERFDAVLLDMRMPTMDGLEAAREIRKGGPNADAPLIALTANAFDSHRAQWTAAGGDAFLTKPIDPTALRETLAKARAQRPVSAAI